MLRALIFAATAGLMTCMPAHAQQIPAGVKILASVRITGTRDRAEVYRHGGVLLTVVSGGTVIWHRRVAEVPTSLTSPQQSTFLAIVPAKHGARAEAMTVDGTAVKSAIQGSAAGTAYGDEGATPTAAGFNTEERDWKHVGSVRYRIESQFVWSDNQFTLSQTVHVPDYAPGDLPFPSATMQTHNGDTILLRLEVADTEAERETGLMNRASLDPDSGMVFVFQGLTVEGFWMKNTEIPLSVAFIDPFGQIVDIQDMAPETTNLHLSAQPYQYAIETNQGFFAAHGIKPGDHIQLNLPAQDKP